MNNIKTIFLLISFLSIAAACGSSKNVKTFSPAAPQAGQASVYIYRPLSMSNAFYSPDLYINGEFRLSVKTDHSTQLTLPPGKTIFELAPDERYTGKSRLELELEAGNTYFIRVGSGLKINHAPAGDYAPYDRSFNLTITDEKPARNQIAECCASDTTGIIDKLEEIIDPPDTGTFSVDKTQNPFSH
ncbi:MAG: DUF2846 domain-containing protein [Gammaproteobacteria bacterium]|nr:DUF2846 domain-containing protein [Gammaproteobacteria bacterium]